MNRVLYPCMEQAIRLGPTLHRNNSVWLLCGVPNTIQEFYETVSRRKAHCYSGVEEAP